MVEVSIVIVSWNTKQLLVECIESISVENAAFPIEVIVVDNASTDGSAEEIAERFPWVRLIRNESNLGFAKANNIGIRSATGNYVCLINSDVKLRQGCLVELHRFLEGHPAVGIAGPRILYPDLTMQMSCKSFPSLWNSFCAAVGLDKLFPKSKLFSGDHMAFFGHDTTRPVDVLAGVFWMVRRGALEQIGLLDESFFFYGEDVDWCKRFWESGWEVVFYPDAEAIHHLGSSSSNAPVKYYIEQRKAKLSYWRKHHSRVNCGVLKLIILLDQIGRVLSCAVVFALEPSRRQELAYKMRRSLECTHWLLDLSGKYD